MKGRKAAGRTYVVRIRLIAGFTHRAELHVLRNHLSKSAFMDGRRKPMNDERVRLTGRRESNNSRSTRIALRVVFVTYVIRYENVKGPRLAEEAHFVDGRDHSIQDFALEWSKNESLVLYLEGGERRRRMNDALSCDAIHVQRAQRDTRECEWIHQRQPPRPHQRRLNENV